MPGCTVCGTDLGAPIYRSGRAHSLTTMNTLVDGETQVFFCDTCGHAQTNALPDLERFYAEEYEINLDGEDDDQLYAVVDGREVYRSEHQANVLAEKIDLSRFRRVLDYGCAKAPTLRSARENAPEMEAYLFDVTDKYIPFWEKFPEPRHYAAFQPDPAWAGHIDVVLSFYALEHVAELNEIIGNVRALLRDGGYFYFIVPNMYANAADFIVADHVNHFSRASLTYMLGRHGFTDIDIDEEAHAAAFVVMARIDHTAAHGLPALPDFAADRARACDLAGFWSGLTRRVTAFEAALGADLPRAIYGAGIYGNYIYSCLDRPEKITHFVDQNRFLAGKRMQDRPIVPPGAYTDDPAALFVGLNPRIARKAMAETFARRTLEYFFLD